MDITDVSIFFGGWLIIIGGMIILSKFEGTRTLLYYLLWTGVALDLVTHGDEISSMLKKFGISQLPNNPQNIKPPQTIGAF